ncbi:MAG: PAS domain-containing sensor histidine kinase, partial [Chitinophagaceae bacterium]
MHKSGTRLQNELKKEKDRFEALFEYASIGIVLTDATGKIKMVNNCLLGQFGYLHNTELVDKPIETLIPRRYEHNHLAHRERYNQHPERRSMGVGRDLFALKKDGSEFPVEVSLSNYSTTDGAFIIAFVIDITKRKEIENAVLLQKEQLQQTNAHIEQLNNELEAKVATRTEELQLALRQIEASRDELSKALSKEKDLGDLKSRFVSMASHEFRTPLSTILSSASLLAKYTKDDEQDKRDKHIQRIKNSVNNLTGILNEFLSIGKIEDGKIEVRFSTFNVVPFVTGLCNEMAAHVRPGQSISYQHSGEEYIELDENLLRNIIFNLLSNAIKFSNEGESINLSTTTAPGAFTLQVSDHGIGISAEDQQHLFGRFFRAANAVNIQGTGLGLHIVARYAELMNG